ncbi:hypothetical protein Q7P35_006822 [Cladosporium inversicolor]
MHDYTHLYKSNFSNCRRNCYSTTAQHHQDAEIVNQPSLATIISRSKHHGQSKGPVSNKSDEVQKGTVAASAYPKTSTSLFDCIQITKIAIVGTGHVGATTAFALVLKGLCDEVVLIDSDQHRAEGEAADLAHASLVSDYPAVYTGSYQDCKDASIIIVTAGQAQKLGDSDEELLTANMRILQDVAPKIGAQARRALLIIAAHPNETLTFAAAKLSGLPEHRVIGFGTSLDTARFKHEIAKHYDVDVRDVHAPVVGVHGMSEIALISSITIDGMPLKTYCECVGMEYETDEIDACFWTAKRALFDVIEHKGHPSMSMAAGICATVEALLRDENTLMTVAAIGNYLGVNSIALSVPTRLSRAGANPLPGWSNDWNEEDALRTAAVHVQDQIRSPAVQNALEPQRVGRDATMKLLTTDAPDEARATAEVAAEYQ